MKKFFLPAFVLAFASVSVYASVPVTTDVKVTAAATFENFKIGVSNAGNKVASYIPSAPKCVTDARELVLQYVSANPGKSILATVVATYALIRLVDYLSSDKDEEAN